MYIKFSICLKFLYLAVRWQGLEKQKKNICSGFFSAYA